MTTQIQVKKTTRYELQEQKEFSRQTYDDVIMRMIKDQKRKTKEVDKIDMEEEKD